jgi:hypothetical protein
LPDWPHRSRSNIDAILFDPQAPFFNPVDLSAKLFGQRNERARSRNFLRQGLARHPPAYRWRIIRRSLQALKTADE